MDGNAIALMGAGLGVGLIVIGAGLGIGRLAAGAAEAIGRQPSAAAQITGAVNLPHRTISDETLKPWPAETLFVVYCAGPHCNGADKAAAKLAAHGRRVKIMIGGITGWRDEGFDLATG